MPNTNFYTYLGICLWEFTVPIWGRSFVKLEIQPVHCMYPRSPSAYRPLLSECPAQAHQTHILKDFIDFLKLDLKFCPSMGIIVIPRWFIVVTRNDNGVLRAGISGMKSKVLCIRGKTDGIGPSKQGKRESVFLVQNE